MITKTFQIDISGIVQGVGFRPFIFKLAFENKLHGDVCNTTSGLIIRINATDITAINNFVSQIRNKKPEPAVIESLDIKEIEGLSFDDFKIIESKSAKENFQLVSPDLATCDKCLNDIGDTTSKRRFNYAFTNCTNCGPRFTIIKKLPYDRKNTTMSDFEMCPECRNEYINPLDRRFHAQPNACSLCGPKLLFTDGNGKILDEKDPVSHAVKEILKGKIIGIKSLGGFQIACDATSDKAVLKLRKKKKRPFKPFAIMIKNIGYIKTCFKASKAEKNLLSSPKAPVVLLRKKKGMNLPINAKQDSSFPISRYVSFNNKYEGVMLPYTPLHHLLFKKINFPLIMTSGNISEEPISCENSDALKKLNSICDFFLIHNRDIYSRFDDSVVKIFKNREMVIRRARGYAPYPLKIKPYLKNETVLAIGSEEKNTFCIVKKNYAIISQHIGDIDNEDSIDFFKNTLSNYRTLFNIDRFNLAVSDKHPAFRLNHLALDCVKPGKKVIVQHHEAHIASAIAENQINKKIVGFAWDGTGYGNDGKIWGSEIFIVDENLNFKRVGHLMEKILPGGEITIRKPYRMAVTYIYYYWINISGERSDLHNNKNRNNKIFSDDVYDFIKYFRTNFYNLSRAITDKEISSIIFQIKNKFNSIETTSMGRLFDALSSILSLTNISSFEGEAAINLEMAASEKVKDSYTFKYINTDNNYENNNDKLTGFQADPFIIDDFDLFSRIIKDIFNGNDSGLISAKFHNTLAEIILDVSKKIREKFLINDIVLSGGVFQNNYLIEKTFKLLENNGFNVYSNFKVPVNDGGVSLGQAYISIKNSIKGENPDVCSCTG